MNRLYQIIEDNKDDMLCTLNRLISIPSVSGEPEPDKPYGTECARVLAEMLKIADDMGFITANFENHAGTIRFDERPEKLGILCHLDVVPAVESEWKYPPFKATLADGRIYGRGAIDDKGPAVAVLYAMKAIKQAGITLHENVRFIVGCNEENGSSDIEYYLTRQKMPPCVFTPDGSYPVINAEKGMIRLSFSKNLINSDILEFEAGNVVNAIPAKAYVVLKNLSENDVPENEKVRTSVTPKGIKIEFNGRAGHASTPDLADNALTGLIDFIKKLPISQNDIKFLTNLSALYPYNEYEGKSLGINTSDEVSGKLTHVMTVAKLKGNTLTFSTDTRFPLSVTNSEVIDKLSEKLAGIGCNVNVTLKNNPHYTDPNGDFIKNLLSVYESHTGDNSGCKAIGGGTYVHDIEGGVAFGAEFPNEDNNMHSADEFITVESLLKNTKIFADAIIKICG